MKGSNRVTSFHVYPDGTVRFSKQHLPVVKVDPSKIAEAEQSGPSDPTA